MEPYMMLWYLDYWSLDNSHPAAFIISQPSAPRCVKIKSINVVGRFLHILTPH